MDDDNNDYNNKSVILISQRNYITKSETFSRRSDPAAEENHQSCS